MSVFAPDGAPGVRFHAALKLDAAAFACLQADVRTDVLRICFKLGLIGEDDTAGMRAWARDLGFPVQGLMRVCIDKCNTNAHIEPCGYPLRAQ